MKQPWAFNNLKEWRKRNPTYQSGSNNPAYKNGLGRSTVARRAKEVLDAAEIDQYSCQECGKRRWKKLGRQNIHHRNGDRSDNTLRNLRVLCARCHTRAHVVFHEGRRNKRTGRYTSAIRKSS